MIGLEEYSKERAQLTDGPESAVEVLEVGEKEVLLGLPESIEDCDRVIPGDAVEFGDEAGAWFAWDLEEKQPRAPHRDGYAGTIQWGRENVSWDHRVGSTYGDVVESLNGTVDGYCDPEWQWDDSENPRHLYPMLIVPHADFSPEPGLILIDLDDVINIRGDGTGVLTREAWNIIQSFGAYTELSSSMEGVHILVRGEIPESVGAKQVVEDLEQTGHAEIRGYPGDGRVIGTTWSHITQTPRDSVPESQDAINALSQQLLDDDEQLSNKEQAQKALEERKSQRETFSNSGVSNRSNYYDLNPERIADTGAFSQYSRNGQGPHPEHGAQSGSQWDSESTNFTVDSSDGWYCFAHGEGGGALELIAVIEGIRDCGNASNVMSDPVDALRVCLAARDKHAQSRLDDENPPTVALKGVCEVQSMGYADGRLSREKYGAALTLYNRMDYTG